MNLAPDSAFTICSPERTMALYTPLNVCALSDALCIKITPTQPCIRFFQAHVNAGCGSRRWQLNSRGAPPPLRPAFVWADRQISDRGETSGNPLSTLRFLGPVKRFVQSIQTWRSFPCSPRQLGFLSTCLDNELLYLSHRWAYTGHKADVLIRCGP